MCLVPIDLFVNTKTDDGPCPNVHSDKLKAQFEKHGDPHMYDDYVEREFINKIAEADRVIKVNKADLFPICYILLKYDTSTDIAAQ